MPEDLMREQCTDEERRALVSRLVDAAKSWRRTAILARSQGRSMQASDALRVEGRLLLLASVARSKAYAHLLKREVVERHKGEATVSYASKIIASFPGGKLPRGIANE